ncbi:MAG: hypothetical protein V2I36_07085 [Desulfopila sp.]|jgi:hypothetical protein|nr:hypothetical protein [Desulfopila sp.]
MKGKITKDILLRVGGGVMRIPRRQSETASDQPQRFIPSNKTSPNKKGSDSPPKKHRS